MNSTADVTLHRLARPRWILSWLLTPLYLVNFGIIVVLFHPLLVVATFFGHAAGDIAFSLLNLCLIANFKLIGGRVTLKLAEKLPRDRPLIIVSNHQSLNDVPLLVWAFRAHHPKFIAKAELGRGIPSVSFALRRLGSVLIDRAAPELALPAIRDFGKTIEQKKYAACLFPEGTRTRNGKMRAFKSAGFETLLRSMPSALVVPVVIRGSFELVRFRLRPIPFGVKLSLESLAAIEPRGIEPEMLLESIRSAIASRL